MGTRRDFIKNSALGGTLLGSTLSLSTSSARPQEQRVNKNAAANKPVVIATWKNERAVAAAWNVLSKGGSALDAVETGVKVPEGDPHDTSVGYGGRPDRDGMVTLDSCIMDHDSNCGAVAFLQHIKHPVSVARKVMTDTPHVMMVGDGALKFALDQGFKKEDLLTEESRAHWLKWLETAEYKPVINIENHDTIGMLTLDSSGKLSGACTTSGMAYKMNGRVGDSPIIGAGLFVDGDIGAATATGMGEAVIKVAGSHLVVELMRQGLDPNEACQAAVERVIAKEPKYKEIQVGFIALNIHGEYGGYCIQPGFNYALYENNGPGLIDAGHALK